MKGAHPFSIPWWLSVCLFCNWLVCVVRHVTLLWNLVALVTQNISCTLHWFGCLNLLVWLFEFACLVVGICLLALVCNSCFHVLDLCCSILNWCNLEVFGCYLAHLIPIIEPKTLVGCNLSLPISKLVDLTFNSLLVLFILLRLESIGMFLLFLTYFECFDFWSTAEFV